MNLLHANDRAGEYPPSFYAATRTPLDPFPPLKGEVRADVAVVGGGKGAVIGAAAGAVGGGLIGRNKDRKRNPARYNGYRNKRK